MAESLFASPECELIDRRSWKSFAEARMAVFTWIEGWYNPRRRHKGFGQKSPINFEKELHNQYKAAIRTFAELSSDGSLKTSSVRVCEIRAGSGLGSSRLDTLRPLLVSRPV